MTVQYFEGIGRRKAATARVRIMSGSGNLIVNDRPGNDYFPRMGDVEALMGPLEAVGLDFKGYDITVKVVGGGITGQTDSVKLGLARALIKMDGELKPTLSHGGFLTRDPRIKERKKPGLKRARKAPTYTKR